MNQLADKEFAFLSIDSTHRLNETPCVMDRFTAIFRSMLTPYRRFSARAFLLVLLAAGCGHSTPKSNTLTIVAFGDSTTAERDTIDAVFPDRLSTLLLERGIRTTVYNAGMRGSHTGWLHDNKANAGPHARERFEQDVLEQNPDIVLIQFGINDSYVDFEDLNGPSRIPLEDYATNLVYFVSQLKQAGAQPVLLTPNQFGEPLPEARNTRLGTYAAQVRKIASDEQIPLIDIWKLLPRETTSTHSLDGMHPNDIGHEMVAKEIAKYLATHLLPENQQPGNETVK